MRAGHRLRCELHPFLDEFDAAAKRHGGDIPRSGDPVAGDSTRRSRQVIPPMSVPWAPLRRIAAACLGTSGGGQQPSRSRGELDSLLPVKGRIQLGVAFLDLADDHVDAVLERPQLGSESSKRWSGLVASST